ncbi:MAG: uncharacterized membrane protein (UPF0127 family) [Gammaproteobacteria bacterium]|jgi:uncharacterized membrane protein (UPF0127 family)
MIHGCLTWASSQDNTQTNNQTKNDFLIQKVAKTSNFIDRMRGLLFSSPLKENEGLLIAPCSSVHTFGMRYAIDLVFLDKQLTVVKTVKSLKPWRMAASNAYMVLELAANSLDTLNLTTGQQLEWHDD